MNGVFQGSETGKRYDGTDPVLYNLYSPPGPELPTSPAHWQSYLADLVRAGVSYRVYDDWNWQFGGGTGPTQVDLNVFSYYEPYPAPAGQVTLGTLGDPNYLAPNYAPNSSGSPGDDRPLFAQHVYPSDGQQPFLAPLTWLMPPYNYSEHPPYTSADGAYYIAQIVDGLMQSPFWGSTVLVITYDEGNNAFDHLPPPLSPDPAGLSPAQPWEPWVEDDSGTTDSGPAVNYPAPIGGGMRVPAIIVSPWTYLRGVISGNLDHTSVLHLMETVSGVQCSTLPPAGSPTAWRRAALPACTPSSIRTTIRRLRPSRSPACRRRPSPCSSGASTPTTGPSGRRRASPLRRLLSQGRQFPRHAR